jgi:cold shock CspA family protein
MGGAMGHLGPMANPVPALGAVNALAQFAAMGPMGGMALGMSPMSMAGHMNGVPGSMNGMSSMGNLGSMACDGMQSMFKEREAALARAMSESLRAGASEQGPDSGRADVPGGSSAAGRESARSNVLSLAYRPPNAEPVLGITDRRFEGIIRSFNDQEGYGFLKCDSFDKVWAERGYSKNDVFLHRNQKGTFLQGDAVSFGVFLNFRGKPQATDLRPVTRGEWAGQSADEVDGTGSRGSSG